MARMPKRTRSHVLESESRKYFENLLPSQWVVREKNGDYGIDSEVEIFDECGSATGLVFLVQLKGSDTSAEMEEPRVRVEVSTFNYWRSLDLPVLLVKYYAQGKTVYARWADTFYIHYLKDSQKTFQIPFFESDRWQHSTNAKLKRDVELFRQLRSGRLPFPATLAIERDGTMLNGVPGTLIDSGLRNAIAKLSVKFNIVQSLDPERTVTIYLSNKKTSVVFGGIKCFTIDYDESTDRGDTPHDYVNDTMICFGIALTLAGQEALGTQILQGPVLESKLLKLPQIADMVSDFLLHADRFFDVIEICRKLSGDETLFIASTRCFARLLAHSKPLSDTETESLESLLVHWLRAAEESGSPLKIAVAKYNLGRHSLKQEKLAEAFSLYKESARLDPSYRKRCYFCKELGGLLFLNRNYYLSARWYEHAMCLATNEERDEIRARLADAYFHSRKFSIARECWESYFETSNEACHEICLKVHMAEYIESTQVNVESRESKPERLRNLDLAEINPLEPPESGKSRLRDILQNDPLCGLAWFNYARLCADTGEPKEASRAYLFAALSERNDIESWAYAALTALLTTDVSIHYVAHILCAAYRIQGEDLLSTLHAVLSHQPDEFPTATVLEQINALVPMIRIEAERGREELVQLRIVGEEGKYEFLNFSES